MEVAWASAEQQWVVALEVPTGTTLRGALERARVDDRLPVEALAAASFGIFGVVKTLETTLADGDRVEIYRPLADDPKLIRRRRGTRRARR
ncbi:MAG: RnfH family protein [Gammaproteobacteria bacterium]